MKRSGAAIFLMELMVVIMFFSLAIVTSLRLFMTAYNKEHDSARISEALIEMQGTAERFRARGVDVFSSDGWTEQVLADGRRMFTNEKEDYRLFFEVTLTTESTQNGSMDSGEILAYAGDKENKDPICGLALARYIPAVGGEVAR